MVSRLQNRNTGYSENLFSHNQRMDANTLNSIDGATALKLDESYQLDDQELNSSIRNIESQQEGENEIHSTSETNEDISSSYPTGVSIESASYMENNNLVKKEINSSFSETIDKDDEYTPKLFSEDQSYQSDGDMENDGKIDLDNQDNVNSDQLFDQEINEEDDFEIPAFLRKQKF